MPQCVDDIRIGDLVKFSRPGGKISKGVVKYIGPLSERNETYFGLELDSEGIYLLLKYCISQEKILIDSFHLIEGKHDGVFLNKRYFQA